MGGKGLVMNVTAKSGRDPRRVRRQRNTRVPRAYRVFHPFLSPRIPQSLNYQRNPAKLPEVMGTSRGNPSQLSPHLPW